MIGKFRTELFTRLYRHEPIRRVISPFVDRNIPEQWVFLLGCYNSGTTLLQRLLGSHPDIAVMPREGVRFTSEFLQPEDVGWTRMWIKCQEYMSSENTLKSRNKEKVVKDWSPWWSEPSAKVYLEKSISNLTRVNWLNQNFENPKFIGIIRNGYCVAEGIKRKASPKGNAARRYGRDTYKIEDCAQQWVDANRLLVAAGDELDNILFVHYEELVEEPEAQISNILTFLDLQLPQLYSDSGVLQIGDERWGVTNMNSSSLARLSVDQIQSIRPIIAAQMREMGYTEPVKTS